ncbi:MAG: acetyl-CoA C-acyltransferase [Elusimicrobia bacterium]|nr:MAG: acetyl-CoA C-acyltransferase [Elusimicrobiota bacterium]
MKAQNHKIVLCGGTRTPFGHLARSLAGTCADNLMISAVESTLKEVGVPKGEVDGLIVGWVGQDFQAPNIARVTALRTGLPLRSQAVTVQNNCVSSIEAVAAAARFILAGEGELYIAGGTESMSRLPYTISGPRSDKALRSMETVKKKWGELLESETVAVIDSMERGLTDPVRDINMAGTAEVCAQMHGITRDAQDAYAHESFKRCIEGWNAGFYDSHVRAFKDGDVELEKDEYPFLREDLVAKPHKFAKAPVAFDNSSYSIKQFYTDYNQHMDGKEFSEDAKGTVTLFNSCGRSDGASAVVVATEDRAKALGLPILAELKGWGFYGNDPAHMGIAPALAAPVALKHAGVKFDDLDQIEIHEPFAATVLGIFKVGKERFGHDYDAKYRAKALNPNGGSIAMGHPLGATGSRLLLNLLHALKNNEKGKLGMLAACAGGGMGGAMVVEKV